MNEKKTENRFVTILRLLLLAVGIIFLFIAVFGEAESNTPLIAACACIVVSGVLNVIRYREGKSDK